MTSVLEKLRYALEEYKTGRRVKKDFTEKNKGTYVKLCDSLRKNMKSRSRRIFLDQIRTGMFESGRCVASESRSFIS